MIIKNKVVSSNYKNLIKQGIKDAKGSDNALDFITEEDLKKFGTIMAERELRIKTNFFSMMVNPINNFAKAIKKGNYRIVFVKEENTLYDKSFKEVARKKLVYFVPVTTYLDDNVYARDYLAQFGLVPCQKGPNYLLGAMTLLSEDKMPDELKDKILVAMGADKERWYYEYGVGWVHVHLDSRLIAINSSGLRGDSRYVILAERAKTMTLKGSF